MSEKGTLLITPKTKVGELLEIYPQLEEVLFELAPAFKKLKNPLLRKTVGKVATLQQAAAVGNLPISEIINSLRMAVGQELFNEGDASGDINFQQPLWFDSGKITIRYDASELINAGENPMQEIFSQLDLSAQGSIFQLSTPFVPAPIIELIQKKGFSHYCIMADKELCLTYFYKPEPEF